MFYEIAADFQESFRPFVLYPPITDRAAWEKLDEEWKKKRFCSAGAIYNSIFSP